VKVLTGRNQRVGLDCAISLDQHFAKRRYNELIAWGNIGSILSSPTAHGVVRGAVRRPEPVASTGPKAVPMRSLQGRAGHHPRGRHP
jgi:hypothetical protein